MSYSKFREKWFPRPDPRTPVTPEAIEHIEDGVKRAHDAIDALGDIGDNLANLVTKEEANATYAPQSVATEVSTGRLSESKLRATYAPARTTGPHPELLAAQVKLANAASEPVTIAVMMGSQGEGVGASTFTGRFPRKLQDSLNAKYAPAASVGEVYVPMKRSTGVPTGAEDWTITGTPLNQSSGPRGSAIRLASGVTATATIPGPKLRLFFYRLGTTDVVTIKVDDGAAETVTFSGGAKQRVWEKTVAAGNHTVIVEWSSGTPIFCGHEVTHTAGVRVWDLSVSGASAEVRNTGGSWGAGATDWSEWIGLAYNPDLFMFGLLFNDAASRTPAQYRTDMEACIAKVRAKAPTVPILLCPGWGPDSVYTTWVAPKAEYMAVLRDIAAANVGVAFHDLTELVTSHGPADFGIYNGPPHMNDRGQSLHAKLTADAFMLR